MKRVSLIIGVVILILCNVAVVYGQESEELKFIQISAGDKHVLAIENGNIWAWGVNKDGQLGCGVKMPNSEPIRISGTGDWKIVEAGGNYSIAIKEDGTLWGWGRGMGDKDDYKKYSTIPRKLRDDHWKKVSAGSDFLLAMKEDNTIWKGGKPWKSTPYLKIEQVGTEKDWKDFSVGGSHALLIKKDGSLWVYGASGNGALGLGSDKSKTKELPIQIGKDHDWVRVHAGGCTSMAAKQDKSLWIWGGYGFKNNNFYPTKVEENMEYIDLDIDSHTTLVDKNNEVWTYSGQKYITPNREPYKLRKVEGIKNVIDIENGNRFSVALDKDGQIWSWGDNDDRELGYGEGSTIYTPTQIGTSNKWEKIYGNYTVMRGIASGGIKSDHTLWMWGMNYFGELGHATGDIPMKVNNENDYEKIIIIGDVTYALKKDGTIWSFGEDLLEIRSEDKKYTWEPIQIGNSNEWKDLYGDAYQLVMLKKDGSIWFLKDKSFFKEGTKNINIPRRGSKDEWKSISAHDSRILGIKKDGTLWDTGSMPVSTIINLGKESIDRKFVQIGKDNDWEKVEIVESGYARGMKKDHTFYWIGEPFKFTSEWYIDNSKKRTKIIEDKEWIDFSVAISHVLAIKKDGSLWAWGQNYNGELGDGTSQSSDTPIKISDEKFKAVKACGDYSLVIKEDGTLWGWGKNDDNQLGIKSMKGMYVPTKVKFK
ncbi:MAG: hypothetical protein N4A62_00345 [Marinisporobacter sp.]|jgi:alpha-tubulin suppressor-like RCC1 family protein|nr:hypothetical protein [Marinisporobacter sp.]